jgi:outer membrane receptor protein involved in Fe transport
VSSTSVVAGLRLSAARRTRKFDSRLTQHSAFLSTLITYVAVLLALVLASAISGRAQATDAAIIGNVTDSQGGALPGATVTATNQETGLVRTAVAGDDGHYRLAPLPPGTYALNAQQKGFATIELKGLVLTIGLELPQDVTLQVGSTAQVVTVTANQQTVETTSSEVASDIVDRVQTDTLPISQRQTALLALLEPGTTSDVGRVSRPLASIGAGQVNGAGSNYLLDGLSNVIAGNGDPRDLVQEAVVQEFRVILGQAPAEYGFRAAGIVSVATKSGTNDFHGEAFEYFRDHYINRVDSITQAENESNPAAYPIQPFSRNQFGGEIGGPIKKNKLYGLFSFEELNDQEYYTVAPGADKIAALNTVYAPLEGSFRGGALFREYFGRLDYQFTPSNTAFLRYSQQAPALNYSATGGNAAAFSGSGDSDTRSQTLALEDSWVISPNLVNQFAAQVATQYQNYYAPHFGTPAQYAGGSVEINFPDLTWGWQAPTQFHTFYQEVRDDLAKTHGKHTIKWGFDILSTPRDTDAAATPLGVWTFHNDFQPTAGNPVFDPQSPTFNWASLASAVPTKFTTNFPEIPFRDANLMQGYFVEDEWRLRPNLTLNLGLRYDLETGVWRSNLNASLYPQPLPYVQFGSHGNIYDNLGPRLGFAWDPFHSGRTVVRGGFGIVNVDLQDNAFEGEISTLRQTQITILGTVANPVPYPNPYAPYTSYQAYLAAHPQSGLNVSLNDNNIYNPKVYTWNLGVDRQISSDLSLSVEGMYTHMYGLDVTQNINSPNPVSGLRPLPQWGYINVSSPIGNYDYTGLFVRLNKRFSNRYQYVVSYTLAKQYDNYNSSTAITNYYAPQQDDGPATTDRRHTLVASGSILTHWGIHVGAIWTFRTALPFSALTGVTNSAGAVPYVPGTSKDNHDIVQTLAAVNAWRATQNLAPIPLSQIESNRYDQLDARISKEFNVGERYKIELIGQLFNVLGTNNFGGVGVTQINNASTGSATSSGTFGTFTAAQPKQQGELALRFVF